MRAKEHTMTIYQQNAMCKINFNILSLIYTHNWFWCHFSVLNTISLEFLLVTLLANMEGVHKAGPGGYCCILKHIIKIFPAEITLCRHTDMLHSHCLFLTLTGDFSTAFLIAFYSPVHFPSLGAVPQIQATSFTVELTSFLFTPFDIGVNLDFQIKTHFTLKRSEPRNFNGHGIKKW